MIDECAVLQVLRLKGRVSADALTDVLGEDGGPDALPHIVSEGHAQLLPNGHARLTPEGADRLELLLADERAGRDGPETARLYDEFCTHNVAFKTIVSAWQMRPDGTPNDHADAAYDADVLGQLGRLHEAVRPVLQAICTPVPRLTRQFPRRLDEAWARVSAGDMTYVARPLANSYHTVWFELHEELIGLVGTTRAVEAAAGRA